MRTVAQSLTFQLYGHGLAALLATLMLGLAAGCKPAALALPQNAEQRGLEARKLFETIVKEHHLPAADMMGTNQAAHLNQAAQGYESLLKAYPEQTNWCAQALRSLGNVRATEGRLEGALTCYKAVVTRYPAEDWEILQALKSGGDLLWDVGRRPEARRYYGQIVSRFDNTNATAIMQIVVKGAKARMREHDGP